MGNEYALSIILPDETDGLAALVDALTPESFTKLVTDLEAAPMERVQIYLPKVKIEASYNLNDALAKLGLSGAFGGGADFSRLIEGIGPGGLAISDVLHKTFLEID